MDIDSSQKTRPTSARRRLLRGVFSAPAALTLYSGGAIAAASNQQCVASLQTNPVTPLPTVADTNLTYVRIGLYKRSNVDQYFVKGSDLQQFRLAAYDGWPSSSQVRRFDISRNVFEQAPATSPPNDLESLPTQWAVLRIDGSGTVVGVGASGVLGGSAIYQSCWTSFVGLS